EGEEGLFVTMHPGYFASSPAEFTYDNNPGCTAYIKKGEGKYYFAGGFNGGRTEDYLKMIRCLAERIEEDLRNDIIALWHDESQLNRYMNDLDEKYYRILSPAYLYPEDWDLPFKEKITVMDKRKKGGHEFLRT
nr:glycosyl transferase family 6 [Lachnospiraceae bacterium]